MAVLYDEAARTLTLNTAHTTYQMKINEMNILLHTYYGPSAGGDLSYAIQYLDRGFYGNPFDAGMDRTFSLAVVPQEYPCEGSGDYRRTAFGVRDERGVSGCDLRYAGHSIHLGKNRLQGMPYVYAEDEEADTLEVSLRDDRLNVEVRLFYSVLPEADCIVRSARITNRGNASVVLENAASTCVDFLHGNLDMISFWGKHSFERQTERRPVDHCEMMIGSRRGASSHQMNPFMILCDHETTEDHGMALGLSLLWSGSFSAHAGMDPQGQVRACIGVQSERFNYELQPGEWFHTPEAAMILSMDGLTGMSQKFHDLVHDHIIRGPWRDEPRPILINNWEATYFDFTGEKLIAIARQAQKLGVDMMVLDDGWFGNRCGDHDGLGDWVVNEEKLGCSMKELADGIHGMGMRFGLWIEPEMVNMPSMLYHEHPDWAYTIPGKDPVRSRDQLVLDFSRREVEDYIFESINKVVHGSGVDYIKMDMNRSLNDVCTAVEGYQSQGKVLYKYMLGVYSFIQRLLDANPGLLIEGCSGGGARFDMGMLFYTPQIWCSDDTDAIERLKIQYGTSFGYPLSCTGAHVTVAPNHQTGRVTSLNVRGAVAMAGTFGYELDLNPLSDEEKEEVRQQIITFRKYRKLTRFGRYWRLTDNMKDREKAAWMITARDASEALVTVVTISTHDDPVIEYVRCKGLDANAVYEDEATGESWTGSALMYAGLPVKPHRGDYTARQYHLIRK